MSNIFSIIVLAIIAIGMFKMFGRYIAVALACAVIGGIIGACTTNGSWETYAEYGAAAGFVLSFILYFKDAWLTFLGVIIGAAIGMGIGHFIPENGTMWGTDLILGLALIGGAILSPQAAKDLTLSHPGYSNSNRPNTFVDGLGNEHVEGSYQDNICGTCLDYDSSHSRCLRHDSYLYSGYKSRACEDHR